MVRRVWNLGEATVRQVHESLPKSQKVDFTTVQTYLTRLEEKGYLTSRKEGRARVFRMTPDGPQPVGEGGL